VVVFARLCTPAASAELALMLLQLFSTLRFSGVELKSPNLIAQADRESQFTQKKILN
jgi:hypothetical protein